MAKVTNNCFYSLFTEIWKIESGHAKNWRQRDLLNKGWEGHRD